MVLVHCTALLGHVTIMKTSCFNTDFVSQMMLTKLPLMHCFFLKTGPFFVYLNNVSSKSHSMLSCQKRSTFLSRLLSKQNWSYFLISEGWTRRCVCYWRCWWRSRRGCTWDSSWIRRPCLCDSSRRNSPTIGPCLSLKINTTNPALVFQQECIPVGCLRPLQVVVSGEGVSTHWGCLPGVSDRGVCPGWCLPRGTVCPGRLSGWGGLPRGCLLKGGWGLCLPRGVSTSGGVHHPPVDGILDTCLWKHCLSAATVVDGKNGISNQVCQIENSFEEPILKVS